ncbi:MAG: hypothetical protein LBM97_02580 [Candidatus Nomurabacteria bacterium]|jgi:hypothetical protein|nr:hypothetical protein [Candidatus Nomurabacteria bacterium]
MKKKEYNRIMKNKLNGAVSLYVVIFTTLLLSIISLGFLRIMLGEQQSATDKDMSASAYDAAMAGVEDAKVAVLAYQECASKGFAEGTTGKGLLCSDVLVAFTTVANGASACDTVSYALGDWRADQNADGLDGHPETPIQQNPGDADSTYLDEAYTCVKIKSDTPDYLAELSSESPSLVIPLRFRYLLDTPNMMASSVNKIIVRWGRAEDANGAALSIVDNCDEGMNCFLPRGTDGTTQIPVIRWQLINPGTSFSLDDLNAINKHAALFLIPSTDGGAVNVVDGGTVRQSGSAIQNTSAYDVIPEGHTPISIACDTSGNYAYRGYACEAQISLPAEAPIPIASSGALLRLTAYYGSKTSISVEGQNSANQTVMFDAVQPEVDSTGRASDLFRRVLTRIDLTDAYFPYPEYALELRDSDANLCKNFLVLSGGAQSLDISCN